MPKSKVYLIRFENSEKIQVDRFKRLLEESHVLDFIRPKFNVAVKMHFGEEGNTGFVKPEYLRIVCDRISAKRATAFISDTNTLYRGRRSNSFDHLALAGEHGFTYQATGARIIVPEDNKKNIVDMPVNKKFIKAAKVARIFVDADAIVGVSHFKGHLMTGFGGALKNIGMGTAAREGKLQQHAGVSPVVYQEKCTGCGECQKACPVKAIVIQNNKSVINGFKCIGCATCIAICPYLAIDVPWGSGAETIQEKMIEYAFAVLKNKKEKTGFINFAIKITKECDCLAKDDPRVAPDVGILASADPVSIDQAGFDLVNQACGKDIFKELHPQRDGTKQLKYAQELGLGNLDYELIEL